MKLHSLIMFIILFSLNLQASHPADTDKETHEYITRVLFTIKSMKESPADVAELYPYQKNILELCCIIYQKRDKLFAQPGINPKLQDAKEYIFLQTPPEPTAAQLPLMPLKYLNAFGHVINNLRPMLETDPDIAKVLKKIPDERDTWEFKPSNNRRALLNPTQILKKRSAKKLPPQTSDKNNSETKHFSHKI